MLDTDTSSYVIRGRMPEVAAKLSALPPADVCISVMTRAELRDGLNRLPPAHRLHAVARRFLAIVRVLPWGADAADIYADIRHQPTTSGTPIGELDMMIAAHALAVGAVLVTNNERHFRAIAAPLMLANWVGAG